MQDSNTLKLQHRRREGKSKTTVDYLEFVIDEKLVSSDFSDDFVSCLGWQYEKVNRGAINRLLQNELPDMPDGRHTSLYVCPECGDIECGAIGAIIERSNEGITWRDFVRYSPESIEPLPEIGPFLFDRSQYETALPVAAE